jgi:hypothetical protein
LVHEVRKNGQSQVSPSEWEGTQPDWGERIFIKYLYTVF